MNANHKIAITASTALLLATLNVSATEQIGNIGQGYSTLSGAGSPFIAPLVKQWSEDYQKLHPKVGIEYDVVGSGEGVHRFVAGAVDFAASDGGMTDAQVAQVSRGVRFIPATIGGVVLAYNIRGIKADLKLGRDVYPDIFSGKIQTWDDPRIKAANPDLPLPHENIIPVVRQDSSGTTFAFTNHLSAVSKEWQKGQGVGTNIDWPGTAMAVKGNEGVAARVKISEFGLTQGQKESSRLGYVPLPEIVSGLAQKAVDTVQISH